MICLPVWSRTHAHLPAASGRWNLLPMTCIQLQLGNMTGLISTNQSDVSSVQHVQSTVRQSCTNWQQWHTCKTAVERHKPATLPSPLTSCKDGDHRACGTAFVTASKAVCRSCPLANVSRMTPFNCRRRYVAYSGQACSTCWQQFHTCKIAVESHQWATLPLTAGVATLHTRQGMRATLPA